MSDFSSTGTPDSRCKRLLFLEPSLAEENSVTLTEIPRCTLHGKSTVHLPENTTVPLPENTAVPLNATRSTLIQRAAVHFLDRERAWEAGRRQKSADTQAADLLAQQRLLCCPRKYQNLRTAAGIHSYRFAMLLWVCTSAAGPSVYTVPPHTLFRSFHSLPSTHSRTLCSGAISLVNMRAVPSPCQYNTTTTPSPAVLPSF